MTTSVSYARATRLIADARALVEQAAMEGGARRRDHLISASRLVVENRDVAPEAWWLVWDNLVEAHAVTRAIRQLTGWCWHCLARLPAPPVHKPKRPDASRDLSWFLGGRTTTARKVRRARWFRQIIDAHALLDEAARLSGDVRRKRLVGAARLVEAAGSIEIPRSDLYAAWKDAVGRAEEAVFQASGEYPSSLALLPRQRRRIDAAIAEGRADYAAGRCKSFGTVEDLIADLHAGVEEDTERKARRKAAKRKVSTKRGRR